MASLINGLVQEATIFQLRPAKTRGCPSLVLHPTSRHGVTSRHVCFAEAQNQAPASVGSSSGGPTVNEPAPRTRTIASASPNPKVFFIDSRRHVRDGGITLPLQHVEVRARGGLVACKGMVVCALTKPMHTLPSLGEWGLILKVQGLVSGG